MVIDEVRKSYLNWIKENTLFSDVLNNSIEISSPYVDSLNENVKIYLEPQSNGYRITDDGYTLWSLESSGMSFRKGSHRQKLLYNVIDRNKINLDIDNKELYILADQDKLGEGIHTLIQSVLSISDFLKFDTKKIKRLFLEEVNEYFKDNKEIFDYFPDIELQGRSKLCIDLII